MQISQPPHGKLVTRTWGRRHCELGLSAAAHRHRFEHPDAAFSLAALLVPLSLARYISLGAATAPSWRQAGLHCSSPPGNRYHVSRLGLRPWRLRPPKLRDDRYHRPLVFHRPLPLSSSQARYGVGTLLELAPRRLGKKGFPPPNFGILDARPC